MYFVVYAWGKQVALTNEELVRQLNIFQNGKSRDKADAFEKLTEHWHSFVLNSLSSDVYSKEPELKRYHKDLMQIAYTLLYKIFIEIRYNEKDDPKNSAIIIGNFVASEFNKRIFEKIKEDFSKEETGTKEGNKELRDQLYIYQNGHGKDRSNAFEKIIEILKPMVLNSLSWNVYSKRPELKREHTEVMQVANTLLNEILPTTKFYEKKEPSVAAKIIIEWVMKNFGQRIIKNIEEVFPSKDSSIISYTIKQKFHKAYNDFEKKFDRKPISAKVEDREELAKLMGFEGRMEAGQDVILNLFHALKGESFDKPISDDNEDGGTLQDVLESNEENPEQLFRKNEFIKRLVRTFQKAPESAVKGEIFAIVVLRYMGYENFDKLMKPSEIATALANHQELLKYQSELNVPIYDKKLVEGYAARTTEKNIRRIGNFFPIIEKWEQDVLVPMVRDWISREAYIAKMVKNAVRKAIKAERRIIITAEDIIKEIMEKKAVYVQA